MFRFSFFILLFFCLSNAHSQKISGYHLSQPDQIISLPYILHEVSGITSLDNGKIACVQDENGIIFIYDLLKKRIEKQIPFYFNGDYEGITTAHEILYVLRSDGKLFSVKKRNSDKPDIDSVYTGIIAPDNEGLCFDINENRLLIATKGRTGKEAVYRDKRAIYEYDLSGGKLESNPAFEFNLKTIKQFAIEHKVPLPSRPTKKGRTPEFILKFLTSAIAIHPTTHQLFLLSAADYMIFIFNKDGSLVQIEKLNPHLFNKPEGMTFLENGDMLISNEGGAGVPTLLRFNYKKQ